MTVIGFHASHEQAPPSRLLEAVQRAEEVGFDAAMCSDHFAPWSVRQGHSGSSWVWLGAALATTRLRFGVVTAPGQRAHPAVVAQAIGTLGEMFPGRFWAALGSGEAINEHITGEPWPSHADRNARLHESADAIHRLLRGETVSTDGHVRTHEARLWSQPDAPPPLVGAAISSETAAEVAGWAEGLITTAQAPDTLNRVISAYRDAGGRGPVAVQAHFSWAPTDDEALDIAHDQWRHGVITPPELWEIETPEEFDRRSAHATRADTAERVFASADPQAHLERLKKLTEHDIDELYLHNVGQHHDEYLTVFGREVLPELKGAR